MLIRHYDIFITYISDNTHWLSHCHAILLLLILLSLRLIVLRIIVITTTHTAIVIIIADVISEVAIIDMVIAFDIIAAAFRYCQYWPLPLFSLLILIFSHNIVAIG